MIYKASILIPVQCTGFTKLYPLPLPGLNGHEQKEFQKNEQWITPTYLALWASSSISIINPGNASPFTSSQVPVGNAFV